MEPETKLWEFETLKKLIIDVIVDEIVTLRKRTDNLNMTDNNIDAEIVSISTTTENIFDIAYRFQVLDDCIDKANEIYKCMDRYDKNNKLILLFDKSPQSILPSIKSPSFVNIGDCLNMYIYDNHLTDNPIVQPFAEIIANLQKLADEVFYKDNPPKYNDNTESANILYDVTPIKRMVSKLGISKEVYNRAYQIYDFRNSGRTGYTLKDGKIVKI